MRSEEPPQVYRRRDRPLLDRDQAGTLRRVQQTLDTYAAATPAPGGWFRSARDMFPVILRGASRQLETFAWSGWVFNTLDLYLESRHGFMYSKFGDAAASRQLSKARGSDWLVLPAASAVELLAALNDVVCDASDLTAFIASEHGPDGAAEEVVAVHSGSAHSAQNFASGVFR